MSAARAKEVSESAARGRGGSLSFSPAPPLELAIGERVVHFDDPDHFEFALYGRTQVPAGQIAVLMERPGHLLVREAHGIKQVEDRLVDALRRSMLEPGALEERLTRMRPAQFSRDHDWRLIMESLKDMPARFGAYKRIALTKYVQYLAARREVLKAVFAGRRHRLPDLSREIRCPGDGDEDLGQTLLFDLGHLDSMVRKAEHYQRIPKGETLEFQVRPRHSLKLKLARHKFRLAAADGRFQLVDEAGESHRIDGGVTLIGRGEGCDVTLRPEYGDVSRRHVMVETVGSEAIQLTDFSSHGTYLLEDDLSRARPVLPYLPR
jgi:hypothetical protein